MEYSIVQTKARRIKTYRKKHRRGWNCLLSMMSGYLPHCLIRFKVGQAQRESRHSSNQVTQPWQFSSFNNTTTKKRIGERCCHLLDIFGQNHPYLPSPCSPVSGHTGIKSRSVVLFVGCLFRHPNDCASVGRDDLSSASSQHETNQGPPPNGGRLISWFSQQAQALRQF